MTLIHNIYHSFKIKMCRNIQFSLEMFHLNRRKVKVHWLVAFFDQTNSGTNYSKKVDS